MNHPPLARRCDSVVSGFTRGWRTDSRTRRRAEEGWGFRSRTWRRGGPNAPTVFGGKGQNSYLLETTGSGVALIDFDGDGWLDVFLVNGTTLEGFPPGQEPTAHLYRNRRDGTFEDVTRPRRRSRSPAGARRPASATTTPTDATTSS